mmetsp:Transcript_43635/g.51122  ORF Transcript_43635/g.51122 Transcript_43635/m.51122 type:complete len:80 (-) Transcript_43635:277-516(-)
MFLDRDAPDGEAAQPSATFSDFFQFSSSSLLLLIKLRLLRNVTSRAENRVLLCCSLLEEIDYPCFALITGAMQKIFREY